MKHIYFTLLTVFLSLIGFGQTKNSLEQIAVEVYYNQAKQLNFVKIDAQHNISQNQCEALLQDLISKDGNAKLQLIKSEQDELGYTHKRFAITYNGIQLHNKVIAAHFEHGRLASLNGDLYVMQPASTGFSIGDQTALSNALAKVKAQKYKWENKEEENHMRTILNQPNFTYYPSAKRVYFEMNGNFKPAYQFEIYAEIPLYKANVFVDANSGLVLAEQNLICNIDVPATAATKYSGTQTITCDQVTTSSYRLREIQRGLGIETYNMNHTTSYLATDFTTTSTSWTTTGADQAATDAHWGAEKTFDYYMARFNRNSIDNMGYKLRSYVHYSNNYNNAFWDGTRMTYGDGNGSQFTILTAIDVCGHEITHGLVSNTSGLNGGGTGEADALNEAFADIFGTSVERYARPTNYNWKMGSDITPNGNGIRNMQFPKLLSDPDTYLGQYWDPNGEPHNNAGPAIKWFYLLVSGGTATNDLNNTYNVSGLGNIDAEKIAYRALTYYFTSSTNYAAARVAAIQAAKDLFGSCSNQVVQTTNAWYAVGVGAQFVPNQIAPNFYTSNTSFCVLPASVIFTNSTNSGITYAWNYGDGSAVSTSTTGFHTYTANGSYNVKLIATGC
ncbi:MAG: M4 family metallopeptidase, partial [Bacteroidota bacterium]